MSKMMNVERRPTPTRAPVFCFGLASALLILTATTAFAQLPGTENGEWRYLGGDAGHTTWNGLRKVMAICSTTLSVLTCQRCPILAVPLARPLTTTQTGRRHNRSVSRVTVGWPPSECRISQNAAPVPSSSCRVDNT